MTSALCFTPGVEVQRPDAALFMLPVITVTGHQRKYRVINLIFVHVWVLMRNLKPLNFNTMLRISYHSRTGRTGHHKAFKFCVLQRKLLLAFSYTLTWSNEYKMEHRQVFDLAQQRKYLSHSCILRAKSFLLCVHISWQNVGRYCIALALQRIKCWKYVQWDYIKIGPRCFLKITKNKTGEVCLVRESLDHSAIIGEQRVDMKWCAAWTKARRHCPQRNHSWLDLLFVRQ